MHVFFLTRQERKTQRCVYIGVGLCLCSQFFWQHNANISLSLFLSVYFPFLLFLYISFCLETEFLQCGVYSNLYYRIVDCMCACISLHWSPLNFASASVFYKNKQRFSLSFFLIMCFVMTFNMVFILSRQLKYCSLIRYTYDIQNYRQFSEKFSWLQLWNTHNYFCMHLSVLQMLLKICCSFWIQHSHWSQCPQINSCISKKLLMLWGRQ